jgi:capsular exopolysaccharide synthesis family protein
MLPKTKAAVFNENDLAIYLATAVKHIRLMLLLVCLSLLGGVTYYLYARSAFYAKDLVRYQNFARPVDSESIWKENEERTISRQLSSLTLIARTIQRFGLDPSPKVLFEKYLVKRLPRIVRTSEKDFTIEVYAYSPRIARDWAKTLLEEYIAQRDERRLDYAEKAITSLTTDMSQMKERMEQSINQKFDFKAKNDMDKLSIELNELKAIPQQLTIIKHRLTIMEGIKTSLADPTRDVAARLSLIDSLETDPSTIAADKLPNNSIQVSVGQIVPLPATANSSTATDLVVTPSLAHADSAKQWITIDKDRHRLQKEIAIKSQKFLPGHPQIAGLKKQLDALNKSLDLEYEIALDAFNVDYANLCDKQKQLEAKLPAFQEVSRRHEHLLKEYVKFDSGQLAWGNYYAQLSKKLETIDFGFDRDRAEYEYAGHLVYNDKPISPQKGKLILYSLIMGCLLAVGIPFLIEYMNGRVSDVEQAEETLRIRALGVVPKITDISFDSLVMHSDSSKPDSHLKESFRLIRTNLAINTESGVLPQVILVTSSMPQEGKTCVAANLALSFATKGEKTLLIDGDLRRGRAHKIFEIQHRPGLSDILSNRATLFECSHPVADENLTLITCGKHLNSASELLDSDRFANLMTELRGKYQRIILDSPPVLGLSETLIMQRHADGVLMVIWSDFTPMSSVKSAMQALQVNGAKFCGFVLNRLDFSALTNRYKYFYYAPLYYANYQPLPTPAVTSKT